MDQTLLDLVVIKRVDGWSFVLMVPLNIHKATDLLYRGTLIHSCRK